MRLQSVRGLVLLFSERQRGISASHAATDAHTSRDCRRAHFGLCGRAYIDARGCANDPSACVSEKIHDLASRCCVSPRQVGICESAANDE